MQDTPWYVAPARAADTDELAFEIEGPFALDREASGSNAELYAGPAPSWLAGSWRTQAEAPPAVPDRLTPIDYARAAATASRDAALRNAALQAQSASYAWFHTRPPTLPGSTLDVTRTRADLGDAGTSYSLTGDGLATSLMSGDPGAHTFYCSGLQYWALAATGYDVTRPLVGSDGQPYTWTRRGTEVKITLKAIIDGELEAVEAMTLVQQRNMTAGGSVGGLTGAGHTIGHSPGGDALAVKGAAGGFVLGRIGSEVSELEQKPGDFAQSRRTTPGPPPDTALKHRGFGHAWQVWSVRVRGSAMFGKPGSPAPARGGPLDGWHDDIEFVLDRDTQPGLVGPHTVLAAQRIEANVAGAGTLLSRASGGDGGVQITREQAVPDHGLSSYTGYVVYYGRLGTSPWSGWTPAQRPA
jgi:hypothetical protein